MVSPSGKTSGALLVIEGISSIISSTDARPISSTDSIFVVSTIIFSGVIRIGAVVSTTVIVCVAVDELPEESVAVQVTMVSPRGKTSGALLVIDDISTRSDTRTPISSITLLSALTASILMSEGAAISGKTVSTTVIVWFWVEVFPTTSVAVQVTMVSPRGNTSGALLVIDDISTRSDASAEL